MSTTENPDATSNNFFQIWTYPAHNRQGQPLEISLAVAPGNYPVVVLPAEMTDSLALAEFNRLANQVVQDFKLDPTHCLWLILPYSEGQQGETLSPSTRPAPAPTPAGRSSSTSVPNPAQYRLLDFYLYPANTSTEFTQVWWDGSYRDLDPRVALATLERLGGLPPQV